MEQCQERRASQATETSELLKMLNIFPHMMG